jgi:hypothetical protein
MIWPVWPNQGMEPTPINRLPVMLDVNQPGQKCLTNIERGEEK